MARDKSIGSHRIDNEIVPEMEDNGMCQVSLRYVDRFGSLGLLCDK